MPMTWDNVKIATEIKAANRQVQRINDSLSYYAAYEK